MRNLDTTNNIDIDEDNNFLMKFDTVNNICPKCRINNTLIIYKTDEINKNLKKIKMFCFKCNYKIIETFKND